MENGIVHEKRDGTMRRVFVSLKGKKIAAAGIAVLLLASAVMPDATFAGDGRGEKARMVKIIVKIGREIPIAMIFDSFRSVVSEASDKNSCSCKENRITFFATSG